MAGHARLLDRRRFEAVLGRASGPEGVLGALDGYRNPDGGYGWGLEPDLRSRTSQPGGALHAFEALRDAGPAGSDRAVALCDWLESVTLPDGGLPFALPVPDPAACAPFWAQADSKTSSLQITGMITAEALRIAAYDPAVAAHPWTARATAYCLAAIEAIEETPHALVLYGAIRFLDAVYDAHPQAPALLDRLRAFLPRDGLLHVAGGLEDEMMRPLDFAPEPGRPARALLDPEAVAADLDRLAAGQREDGGWAPDFTSYSPAAALEWRGHTTVRAVSVLVANGVVRP
ncbi:hypothetical protein GCM10023259_059270 [Thermocatellispora tengchongensis]